MLGGLRAVRTLSFWSLDFTLKEEIVMLRILLLQLQVVAYSLSVLYYGYRVVTMERTKVLKGWADPLSEFGHFSCPAVMLPMVLGYMAEYGVVLVASWFCIIMAWVFLVAWLLTHGIPKATRGRLVLLSKKRSYMKLTWDLPHSLMFYVMHLTYEMHLGPLSDFERFQLQFFGAWCIYYAFKYVLFVVDDCRKYKGRMLFYEFSADSAHVFIFGGCAGMAIWPGYFM